MYRKIWVTGGTGLVGQALQGIQNEYKNKFIFTNTKECDLRDRYSVLEFAEEHNPDAIIHLAAISGGVGLKNHASIIRDNTWMNLSILEVARVCKIKKVIMTLSTGMYANGISNPIKEELIHYREPDKSNYGYAFSKRLIEPLIRAYREECGLNVIGLIPNGIIGKNGNYKYNESTMVFSLVRRFYENRDNNKPIIVWGDGNPLREYTYAEDLARAYMWCLNNYDDTQILHIGSVEEYSIKDVAYMIADIMNVDKTLIQFDASKPSGQFKKSTDNSRFVGLSGFKYTPFKIALKETIEYFIDNYDSGRIRL
jgi:GDP-L-fucose synthase